MIYYDIKKNWRKIKKHIESEEVQNTLVHGFNLFTTGLNRGLFEKGMLPERFDSCDWRFERRGRQPEYFKYVCHSACHWLVNFNLVLAQKLEPNREWRIVTCQEHSTVYDGENMLFDFNFSALGIEPDEAYKIANKKKYHLKVGQHKRLYPASRN